MGYMNVNVNVNVNMNVNVLHEVPKVNGLISRGVPRRPRARHPAARRRRDVGQGY